MNVSVALKTLLFLDAVIAQSTDFLCFLDGSYFNIDTLPAHMREITLGRRIS